MQELSLQDANATLEVQSSAQIIETTDHEMIYYDGNCGLCHASVRFVLRHDATGRFHFAPIGGEYFQSRFSGSVFSSDTVILEKRGSEMLYKSDALCYILSTFGGGWGMVSKASLCIPKSVRDLCYDIVARTRGTLTKSPLGLCPVVPDQFRARFHH